MPERLTPEQFRALHTKPAKSHGFTNGPKIRKSSPVDTHTSVQEQLRAMGKHFEIPDKSINFYIRQMELAGKL